MHNYQIVSPSLDGVLRHESLIYEGIKFPAELLKILDGSNKNSREEPKDQNEIKVIEEYFNDLYGVFIKKFSHFFVESEPVSADTLKLQAMLQEMIKLKKMISEWGKLTNK